MRQVHSPERASAARTERGLALRELASLVGCSHAHIANVLAGAPVSDALARKIARALRRPVNELFTGVMNSEENPRARTPRT